MQYENGEFYMQGLAWNDPFRIRTYRNGMSVSVMFPPEKIWGYELVTSAYGEEPVQSWQRIFDRVKKLYPDAGDADVVSLIGKMTV